MFINRTRVLRFCYISQHSLFSDKPEVASLLCRQFIKRYPNCILTSVYDSYLILKIQYSSKYYQRHTTLAVCHILLGLCRGQLDIGQCTAYMHSIVGLIDSGEQITN